MLSRVWIGAATWTVLALFGAGVSGAQVYDLTSDWSDVNNPNGQWTRLKAPGVPFAAVQPDWYNNSTNPKQPAWADASGPNPFPVNPLVPMWAKAVGDMGALTGDPNYNGFVDAGTVFMAQAPETFRTGTDFSSVVWTSPGDGTIYIDGGVWLAQAFQDRPHQWELRKNGTAFTGGPLTYGDGYDKSNPYLFSLGSGGSSGLNLSVNASDTIELLIYKTGSYFTPGTFMAIDMSVELVPEPNTLALFGTGVIFAFGLRCRRRAWRGQVANSR